MVESSQMGKVIANSQKIPPKTNQIILKSKSGKNKNTQLYFC
jgi:hypothetical protein